ncbi:MAG: glycosyltransferase family 2 protein [Flavobacteriales bacterium]|nr:glycosyltransferase family 2 protein [Flavobacteriales bacterium]
MTDPLVSIIIPVFNAEAWINECIASALKQDYPNIELIICDNGSTDRSLQIIRQWNDPRLYLVHESKKGVGFARNKAMDAARGQYLCFLDADDVLPSDSISLRMQVLMQDQACEFVDGHVAFMDTSLSKVNRLYVPAFSGNPIFELAALRDTCMCGITWLIRKKPDKSYRFPTDVTHCEDLLFYLSISETGTYRYVDKVVYRVRRGHQSASANLEGLSLGYKKVVETLKHIPSISAGEIADTRARAKRIMWKSYLKQGQFLKALQTFIRW